MLYISLHRHDDGNFFPGSGAVDEVTNHVAGLPLPALLTLPRGPYFACITTGCVILGGLFSLSDSQFLHLKSEEGARAGLAARTSWHSPGTLLSLCLSCVLFSRWELAAVRASTSTWPGPEVWTPQWGILST